MSKPESKNQAAADATEDVAVVCGPTPDGQGVNILRKRGERIEAGTVRKLEAGKPIVGEVVRLTPRPDAPLVCDVDVELPAPTSSTSLAGPAQVASDEYRKNWDAIYKTRTVKSGSGIGNRPLSAKEKRLLN